MNGKLLLSLLASGLLASATTFAAPDEDPAPRAPGQRGPRPSPEERFKAMDTDGNGTVSLAEFKVAHKKRVAEMKKRMGDRWNEERASQRPKPQETFKKLDADGNGELTQ